MSLARLAIVLLLRIRHRTSVRVQLSLAYSIESVQALALFEIRVGLQSLSHLFLLLDDALICRLDLLNNVLDSLALSFLQKHELSREAQLLAIVGKKAINLFFQLKVLIKTFSVIIEDKVCSSTEEFEEFDVVEFFRELWSLQVVNHRLL